MPPVLGLFFDPLGRPRPRFGADLTVVLVATVFGLFLDPGGRPRLFGADLAGVVVILAAGLALFFEPFGRPLRLGASTIGPFNGAAAAFGFSGMIGSASLTAPLTTAED